jgi:hypothetical protein
MEIRKRVLGAEHPSTLTSMANLAYTWKEQGRDAEAIHLIAQCLAVQMRILGADHPNTHNSLATLVEWQTENLNIGTAIAVNSDADIARE